ncbi:MAG: 3-phosphoshikimate 1-carboxyvinyltransferase [Actinobacteria bacterium]|nr:3-phosphoshikimate 1-carboxyvinyltransferase [Actinomycetota bacterium]
MSDAGSVLFEPAGAAGLHGLLQAPADKSISHRAAIIGSICDSPVEIKNFLDAADTRSTLGAIEVCGVRVERLGAGSVIVHGAGLRRLRSPGEGRLINCGNSGTTMRLLPGVLAGQEGCFLLDGDSSLRRRPMNRIVTPLKTMGIDIEALGGGFAPLRVCGGRVRPIDYKLPVASAQVKSALLLAGLYGDGPTIVREPSACRDHTEIMLSAAGARIEKQGLVTRISPARRLHLEAVTVPVDFSSAAFFIVAAAIIPGSKVVLPAVGVNPTRTGLLDILKSMGARITGQPAPSGSAGRAPVEPANDLEITAAPLRGAGVGGEISGRAIDELPLVALAGAFAEGETVVSGASELRVKESDRIRSLVDNLSAIGVDIEARPDGFAVRGGTGIRGGRVRSLGDHRMAMLGAVAGAASREGVEVQGFDCVSVSYPGFRDALMGLISV